MTDLGMPETRYAHSGDINIAYQTMGNGPLDIVIVPGAFSHVEFNHEIPGFTAFMQNLSRFSRAVTFDKRVPEERGLQSRQTASGGKPMKDLNLYCAVFSLAGRIGAKNGG